MVLSDPNEFNRTPIWANDLAQGTFKFSLAEEMHNSKEPLTLPEPDCYKTSDTRDVKNLLWVCAPLVVEELWAAAPSNCPWRRHEANAST